jgi:hypothetical protein
MPSAPSTRRRGWRHGCNDVVWPGRHAIDKSGRAKFALHICARPAAHFNACKVVGVEDLAHLHDTAIGVQIDHGGLAAHGLE